MAPLCTLSFIPGSLRPEISWCLFLSFLTHPNLCWSRAKHYINLLVACRPQCVTLTLLVTEKRSQVEVDSLGSHLISARWNCLPCDSFVWKHGVCPGVSKLPEAQTMRPKFLFSRLTLRVIEETLDAIWPVEIPWSAAHQTPPSMEFFRQEYWSG